MKNSASLLLSRYPLCFIYIYYMTEIFEKFYNIPGAWLLIRSPVPAMVTKSNRQARDVTS